VLLIGDMNGDGRGKKKNLIITDKEYFLLQILKSNSRLAAQKEFLF